MNCEEFYQLVTLLCHDFPQNIIVHVFKTLVFHNMGHLMIPSSSSSSSSSSVDPDSNVSQWLHDIATSHSDISMLQSSYTSKRGISVDQPTFMQFKVGFRCYFFFMEYFEIILHEVFKDHFNMAIDFSTCHLTVLKLMLELEFHIKSTMRKSTTNMSEHRTEVQYCIPTKEQASIVFHRLLNEMKRMKTTTMDRAADSDDNTNREISEEATKRQYSANIQITFSNICHQFFKYLKDCFTSVQSTSPPSHHHSTSDLDNNVIAMVDPQISPLSASYYAQLEGHMKRELNKRAS